MVHDVPHVTGTKTTYECLRCGVIVERHTHPGECDECGGTFQERGMSLE